jgi:hypothetical protein
MVATILQLNPPIPVHVIGKGNGIAWLVVDYGAEHHLLWTVAIDDTGELWSAPNPKVRAQRNYSMQREFETEIKRDGFKKMDTESNS